MSVETNLTKRWEQGIPHHPKSVELFESLAAIDFEHGGDYFCWKSGGDGDNGELFMYELDIHFEMADLESKRLMEPFKAWLLYDRWGKYAPTIHTTRQRAMDEKALVNLRDAQWAIVRVEVRPTSTGRKT